VLDTRGINVWCSAGKGNFGTGELARRIVSSGLPEIVNHRIIIVPQLGAVGVSAHEVKKRTGFKVVYGPVEAADIPAFLEAGREATSDMRRKEFPLSERAALVPMEVIPSLKWAALAAVVMALAGGFLGPGPFFEDTVRTGFTSAGLLMVALVSGSVLVPLLLPWIPGRAFSLKGAFTGVAAAASIPLWTHSAGLREASWTLMIIAVSSFLALNFTGSSTFTSLSGVKREMNVALPAQIVALVAGFIFWVGAFFLGGGSV
jgi:acetyl-CoA decarbonylase/synthase complex subunit gamma